MFSLKSGIVINYLGTPVYLIDVIASIVDAMRDTAIISAIVDNGDDTYKITADPKDVSNGDYITISDTPGFNGEFPVSSVSSTYFYISKTSGQAITTFGSYKANAPYYDHGPVKELIETLAQKSKSEDHRGQRFPLIWLVNPTPEEKAKSPVVYSETDNLKIVLMKDTQPNLKETERFDLNFKPILRPLCDKFIYYIMQSASIVGTKNTDFPRREIYLPFYGGESTGNIINDFIDAIEITNLKLKLNYNILNC